LEHHCRADAASDLRLIGRDVNYEGDPFKKDDSPVDYVAPRTSEALRTRLSERSRGHEKLIERKRDYHRDYGGRYDNRRHKPLSHNPSSYTLTQPLDRNDHGGQFVDFAIKTRGRAYALALTRSSSAM
jgi:arginine utilization protein RocB